MEMEKEDLAIEIYYELDMLRLLSRLCEFAIHNDSKIDLHTFSVVFWDLEKRSRQIAGLVEKLENFEDTLPDCTQKDNETNEFTH